jgi:hypothetical protein
LCCAATPIAVCCTAPHLGCTAARNAIQMSDKQYTWCRNAIYMINACDINAVYMI